MENKEIAAVLKFIGELMDLHNENKFKVRSYTNAAFQISKNPLKISGMSIGQIESVQGIGKNLAPKILEIVSTGGSSYLQQWLDKTPEGVVELLNIKGLGPSKVKVIWKEMGIESIGELLYACNENRLIDYKGFGLKTQQQVKEAIEFLMSNKSFFLYANVEGLMHEIKQWVLDRYPEALISETGSLLRRDTVLKELEFVVSQEVVDIPDTSGSRVKCSFYHVTRDRFDHEVYMKSLPEGVDADLRHIIPEMRDSPWAEDWAKIYTPEHLVDDQCIKGVLHNHSTWSDGVDSILEMASHLKATGYEYFGICDHSKTAVYANGLTEARVEQQHQEIDVINAKLAPFAVYKGIESDILMDGSLDYSDDFLRRFDFVVASVHSVLTMDSHTATARLIKAIEHPATTILGHPTGRLLLARKGYPIDHKKVIDACAANGVAIELNANPMRLDIDHTWIPYCMERQVWVSINPDAHRISGFDHLRYGVLAARKGGLVKELTLNALPRTEFYRKINKSF